MRKILAFPFLCLVYLFGGISIIFTLLHILIAYGWEDFVDANSDLYDNL